MNEHERVIAHEVGPAAVVAGAGSGKTRAATLRAARLARAGERVGLVTFTASAAEEMRQRVLAEDVPAKHVWAGTFHSLAFQILRQFPEAGGYEGFPEVLTPNDELRLFRRLWAELLDQDLDAELRRKLVKALGFFRKARAEEALEGWAARAGESLELDAEMLEALMISFQLRKREAGLASFDDLIEGASRALGEKDVRKWADRRFPFLIVDEYQDTSRAQETFLAALMPGRAPNLMVIGDPNQAIYGWRGAGSRTFERFQARYPQAVLYPLRKNYRSTRAVLRLAERAIARLYRSGQEAYYRLEGVKEEGESPVLLTPPNAAAEATDVAREAARAVASGVPPEEIAVLARSSMQLAGVEDRLARLGVATRLLGGIRLSERREVKTLVQLLKAAWSLHERALVDFIEEAVPGLGERTLTRVEQAARPYNLVDRIMNDEAFVRGFSTRVQQGLFMTRTLLQLARASFEGVTGEAFAERFREFAQDLYGELLPGYLARIGKQGPNEEARRRHLERFVTTVEAFAREEAEGGLDDLLARLAFLEQQDGPAVTLGTVHAVKGLEFEVVFVVGMVEGAFPILADDSDPEEERRLFYVAATRAKRRLYLSAPTYGPRGKILQPSRYLEEALDEGLVRLQKVRPAA